MAQPVARKLLVVGGTGFLGLNICKHAVQRGWETVSLSRKGQPDAFRHGPRPEWVDKVQWASGDSLKPETYQAAMENVTDVIHSVGLISEVDYKGIVSAKGLCEAAAGVARLVTGAKDRGNPLKTSSSSSSPKVTFEMVNRDTAITLAKEAARLPSIDSFVYISAADIMPFINPRYISTKRQAEQFLFSRDEFRTIVFRPGFMYGENRPAVAPLAAAIRLANMVTKPVAKELQSLPLGASLTTPPLNADLVATAVIAAIEKNGLKGIFDVDGIMALSREQR